MSNPSRPPDSVSKLPGVDVPSYDPELSDRQNLGRVVFRISRLTDDGMMVLSEFIDELLQADLCAVVAMLAVGDVYEAAWQRHAARVRGETAWPSDKRPDES